MPGSAKLLPSPDTLLTDELAAQGYRVEFSPHHYTIYKHDSMMLSSGIAVSCKPDPLGMFEAAVTVCRKDLRGKW